LEELLDLATLPRTLKALGVNKKDIPKLAVEANKQWTAVFNPKSVSVSEFEKLYESAFGH
jgi:alcohol dehydrogenase class IV